VLATPPHTRFLFVIGRGYLAMWVLIIFMTDGGLFAIHFNYAHKNTFFALQSKTV
jgi:hypothetical protein